MTSNTRHKSSDVPILIEVINHFEFTDSGRVLLADYRGFQIRIAGRDFAVIRRLSRKEPQQ